MKILVVDDEALLVKGIRFNLQSDSCDVICGSTGLDAIRLTREEKPDLVILDVMMPQMDGLTACKKIREFSTVPIIILTAKSENSDKLTGFDCGADDYLTKPFNILELKARVRALLRRSGMELRQPGGRLLTIGPISLDPGSRNARKNGTTVELTAKEFDLVEFLMKNPNQVFSREALLEQLWGDENRSDSRTVDVHIRRLREKLEENPAEPKYILTKWSVGYYFRKQ
ncbi:MAG: response regulator transcription factor [Faecousia sp.]